MAIQNWLEILYVHILKLALASVEEKSQKAFVEKFLFIEKSLLPQNTNPFDLENPEFMSNTGLMLATIKNHLEAEKRIGNLNPRDEERLKWMVLLLYTTILWGIFFRKWEKEDISSPDMDFATGIALRILRDLNKTFFKPEADRTEFTLENHLQMIELAKQLTPNAEDLAKFLALQGEEKAPFDIAEMQLNESELESSERLAMVFGAMLHIHLLPQWNGEQGEWLVSIKTDPPYWTLRWILRQKSFISSMAKILQKNTNRQVFTHLLFSGPILRGFAMLDILKHYYKENPEKNRKIRESDKEYNIVEAVQEARADILRKILQNVEKLPLTSTSRALAHISLGLDDVFSEGRYTDFQLNDEANIRFWAVSYHKALKSILTSSPMLFFFDIPSKPNSPSFLWQRHMVELPLDTFKPKYGEEGHSETNKLDVISIATFDPRLIIYFINSDYSEIGEEQNRSRETPADNTNYIIETLAGVG